MLLLLICLAAYILPCYQLCSLEFQIQILHLKFRKNILREAKSDKLNLFSRCNLYSLMSALV